jgi:hypothetical protein
MGMTLKQLAHAAPAIDNAADLYTVPAQTTALFSKLTVHNQAAVAGTFEVYLVPAAGSAGVANRLAYLRDIMAGDTIIVDEIKGHVLPAGAKVVVKSNTALCNYCLSGVEMS